MKFTQTHEWIELDDQIATVGISDFAQKELGDAVYVELPTIGHQLQGGDEAVVIESTKAAVDIYSPISGEVVSVNEVLYTAPETINRSPEAEGWLFKLRIHDLGELESLMDKASYTSYLSSS